MKRALALVAVAGLAVACQDHTPVGVPSGPQAAISDATHNLGNPDFFFLPPLVPDPSGDPLFSVGAFNPNLSPDVTICAWAGTACGAVVAQFTLTSGLGSETIRVSGEQYAVNWHTDLSSLDPGVNYRILVSVGTTELGFADVDVVSTGRELRNVNSQEYIGLVDGRTLPIKFRIENGALCEPAGSTCSSASVSLADDVPDEVQLPSGDGVTIPPQNDGGQNVAVTITIQECEEDIDVDLPLFGRCLSITADPPLEGALDPPALIQVCDVDFDVHTAGLSEAQERLVTLHRQSGETIQALPHADDDCAPPVIGSTRAPGLRGLAQAVWSLMGRGIATAFTPRSLNASLVVLDVGGGGESEFFSDFQFALPAQMEPVEGTDGQSATAGTAVANPPAVLVTDRNGDPVAGATVRFEITAGSGQIGATTALSSADGVAHAVVWTLGADPGSNGVTASGRGIAGPDHGGPFMPALPTDPEPPETIDPVAVGVGTVDFTATGTEIITTPTAAVLDLSFGDFIRMHNVSIASDGVSYYTINGGNAGLGQINRYDLAGTFVSTVDVGLDARAILYNPATSRFYVKTFERDLYEVDPNTGSFTLVHSDIFTSPQSSPALTPDGASLVEHEAGTVRVLDFSTGALTATLTGFEFGGISTGSYGVDDAVATDGTHLFTWNGSTVFTYDLSGTSLGSFALPGAPTGFALSFANGLLWASEDGNGGAAGAVGTWFGYELMSGGGIGAPIAAGAPSAMGAAGIQASQNGGSVDDTTIR